MARIDPASLAQYREAATIGVLGEAGDDADTLERIWRDTPADLRQPTDASRWLRPAHLSGVRLARCGPGLASMSHSRTSGRARWHRCIWRSPARPRARKRCSVARSWLAAHPADGELLHALGQLCRRRGLWGKARNYLEAAVAVEASVRAHLGLAELLESLGDNAAALPHLRAAARLAAATPRQAVP
jgi:uncharacterized protein HemY